MNREAFLLQEDPGLMMHEQKRISYQDSLLYEGTRSPTLLKYPELPPGNEAIKNPTLLLINTRVWLRGLSEKYQRPVTIGNVPDSEWKRISKDYDSIWFMGIYKPSGKGKEMAKNWPDQYLPVLPDLQMDDSDGRRGDVVASPFSIPEYSPNPRVAKNWGEWDKAYEKLHSNGVKVMLDFVPNHVAIDHPWAKTHPEYFIHSDKDYFEVEANDGKKYKLAHGKDPYCGSWSDTLQLNYGDPGLRKEMKNVLLELENHSDGVRCDMAMLLNPGTFNETWGRWIEPFWPEAIRDVKEKAAKKGKDFEFIAEAYWDTAPLEGDFDYIYEKGLYDHTKHIVRGGWPQELREHVRSLLEAKKDHGKPLFFIENHDEQRAVQEFGPEGSMAAGALFGLMPGQWMVHEGQREGKKKKLPMQIDRAPKEPVDLSLKKFYDEIIMLRRSTLFQEGGWKVADLGDSAPGNYSSQNIIGMQVERANQKEGAFVCINMSNYLSECRVPLRDGYSAEVYDLKTGTFLPPGDIDKPHDDGMYVKLEPWKTQVVFYSKK